MLPRLRPCIVIPIYNHGQNIGQTVDRLMVHGYPIYIVDDGSDEATQAALDDVQHKHPAVQIFHLPYNQGKGAAVIEGLRQAFSAGHTHALQIDADGQHATEDVPQFILLAESSPNAVICGRPIYDDSVPKTRLYGRYMTHLWVWIETLSFAIADSMCGFRLYPLEPSCRLINRVRLPRRMDFDTEILVRLAWMGLPIKNIPTRVTYPAEGLSHFKLLQDNWRITQMHTRLFFGMLARLPVLLWKKTSVAQSTHWAQAAERGSVWGMRFLMFCHGWLGHRITSVILHPIVGYFFVTSPKARQASRGFLMRVAQHTHSAPPRWSDSYLHMYAFAQSGVDKLSAWRGGIASEMVDFEDQDTLSALIESNRGALLIGSHLGNLEMMRALAARAHQTTITAVVYTDHAVRFNAVMAAACEDFTVNLLQVRDMGADTAIVLKEKIDRGEWLVIVGDRIPPSDNGRVVQVEFMGAHASFALGPILLASLLECPVYLFFSVKRGGYYRANLEKFAEQIELPRARRKQELQIWVQRYAERLQVHALATPLQWFNFFDFWRQDITSPEQHHQRETHR